MKSEKGFEFTGRIHDNLHRVPHISIHWIYQGIWREKLLSPIHDLINMPHYVAQDLEDELFALFVNQAHLDEDEIPKENYASDLPDDNPADYRGWGDDEPCANCGHPYQDHLNGGVQESCHNPHCFGCAQFVSEADQAWNDYLEQKEAEERACNALWDELQRQAEKDFEELIWQQMMDALSENDDAEWPDEEDEEEEEEPTYTQVWYTESPGGHNYWE
jgi:hypothetical protein